MMLYVYQDQPTGQRWETFFKYDDAGRIILTANPSAVTGYDDSKPDLLNADANGRYQYMRQSDGLIQRTDYYPTTSPNISDTTPGGVAGYMQDTKIQRGQQGTPILQSYLEYYAHTGGGATVYPEANMRTYRNPTNDPNDPGKQQTTYSYDWFPSSTRMRSMTVSQPIISAAQNGPGTPDVTRTVYDSDGRVIWRMDGDGYITYTAYDQATGAATKTITDVDTRRTGDFQDLPAGWTTPPGGGLHLIRRMEVDRLGRTTRLTDPNGNLTYTVYDDPGHEMRTYVGWQTATNRPTGPTQVTREDRAHAPSYTETFTMSAAPSVTNGRPDGSEPVSDLQTLSRTFTSPGGQVIETDAYFSLGGLDYSTDPYLGTPGQVQPDGTVTGNYWATTYGYDDRGRQSTVQAPTGTVTQTVYDGLDRVVSTWVGTTDAPLTRVSENVYDSTGLTDAGGVGDGNLTRTTQFPGGGAAPRVTQYFYDWRDRQVAGKSGAQATEDPVTHRPITYTEYDNLGEAVAQERYDGDGIVVTIGSDGVPVKPPANRLRARTTTEYDDQHRPFRTHTYSVDQMNGTVSTNSLTTNTWYDHRGEMIKTAEPGGRVTKMRYDGAGRTIVTYTGDGLEQNQTGTNWDKARTIAGDNVLEQTEPTYDSNGNATLVVRRDRFHDETRTGALSDPMGGPMGDQPKARASYVAAYYDGADRLVATANVGTNGGAAYMRPPTVPARSDTVLVTSYAYNAAGWVEGTTDPRGITAKTFYDNLQRTTRTIAAYTDGIPTNDTNRTTEYTYDGLGHMLTLTARLPDDMVQTTQYVYGVTTDGGSGLNSNDLLAMTRYPDKKTGLPSTDPADQESYTYDALGERTSKLDRNGTLHNYRYDVLGRQTADAVTIPKGSTVDGQIQRLETAYDTGGRPFRYTSYDATSGGAIVNQVEQVYNGLSQLVTEYQSHDGPVNVATTPKVQYAYSEMAGGANHSRMVRMTYPNGRVLNYTYDAGLDDRISRLSSLSDSSGILEAYSYLGLDVVVKRAHPVPTVDLTYVKQAGEPNGDAGDPYTGLDRFGRVVDQRWLKADGSATDRFQYGYDRDGNRLYRDNLIDATFSELYHASGVVDTYDAQGNLVTTGYDRLNRLTGFSRGTLNAARDAIVGQPRHGQDWGLDALGNWGSVTTDGATQERSHNAQNQITAISDQTTPDYDANGNTIQDETGRKLVYDAWNRLVKVDGSDGTPLASYAYDALGRRITEDRGTPRDLYYSTAWQVIEERANGATPVQYVWSPVYVDALVLRDRGTERLYVQQDANWNVTAAVSATGAVQERSVYDPYGQASILAPDWTGRGSRSFGWVYLHQGGRYDAAAGLYDFRHREESPTLGRWMQTDPIGYKGTSSGNLYEYAHANPADNIDPYGLYTLDDALDKLLKTKEGRATYEMARTSLTGREADMPLFDEWYKLEKADMGWLKGLPACPCSIKCGEGYKSPDDSKWELRDITNAAQLHPGAHKELRSVDSNTAGAGQQCTYDENGALITEGYGAGTPDRRHYWPGGWVFGYVGIAWNWSWDSGHIGHDVTPFYLALKIDNQNHGKYVDRYLEVRPPDNGNNCPKNKRP